MAKMAKALGSLSQDSEVEGEVKVTAGPFDVQGSFVYDHATGKNSVDNFAVCTYEYEGPDGERAFIVRALSYANAVSLANKLNKIVKEATNEQ